MNVPCTSTNNITQKLRLHNIRKYDSCQQGMSLSRILSGIPNILTFTNNFAATDRDAPSILSSSEYHLKPYG